MDDLFPETLDAGVVNATPQAMRLHSERLDKWGHPVATLELITHWSAEHGWAVGWLVRLDNALDEWHPRAPDAWRRHSRYPWHRPDCMATSDSLAVAAGTALRAAKIVLAQMKTWVAPDFHQAADLLMDKAEGLAQQLLTDGL